MSAVGAQPKSGPRRDRRASDRDREPVTLLVGDAFAAARAGVHAAVEQYGFRVVAEVSDAASAVKSATRLRPDLCLLAADLPGGGLDATRRIKEAVPGTAVVILSAGTFSDDVAAAVEAGASGYLPRTAAPARLPEALNAALDGYVTLPLPLLAGVVRRGEGDAPLTLPGRTGVRLTPREQQVLEALLHDLSTAQIAEQLSVSQVTVRRYVSDLLRKAGVADRAALLALWDQDPR